MGILRKPNGNHKGIQWEAPWEHKDISDEIQGESQGHPMGIPGESKEGLLRASNGNPQEINVGILWESKGNPKDIQMGAPRASNWNPGGIKWEYRGNPHGGHKEAPSGNLWKSNGQCKDAKRDCHGYRLQIKCAKRSQVWNLIASQWKPNGNRKDPKEDATEKQLCPNYETHGTPFSKAYGTKWGLQVTLHKAVHQNSLQFHDVKHACQRMPPECHHRDSGRRHVRAPQHTRTRKVNMEWPSQRRAMQLQRKNSQLLWYKGVTR